MHREVGLPIVFLKMEYIRKLPIKEVIMSDETEKSGVQEGLGKVGDGIKGGLGKVGGAVKGAIDADGDGKIELEDIKDGLGKVTHKDGDAE